MVAAENNYPRRSGLVATVVVAAAVAAAVAALAAAFAAAAAAAATAFATAVAVDVAMCVRTFVRPSKSTAPRIFILNTRPERRRHFSPNTFMTITDVRLPNFIQFVNVHDLQYEGHICRIAPKRLNLEHCSF